MTDDRRDAAKRAHDLLSKLRGDRRPRKVREVAVDLTDEEDAAIRRAAEAEGVTVERFLHDAALMRLAGHDKILDGYGRGRN